MDDHPNEHEAGPEAAETPDSVAAGQPSPIAEGEQAGPRRRMACRGRLRP